MGQRAGIGEKNRTDRLTHCEDRAARKGGGRVVGDRRVLNEAIAKRFNARR